MNQRITTICNYFLGLLVALNILIFLVSFSNIDSLIIRHLGLIVAFKYYIFLLNYAGTITAYSLGTLMIVAGIRLKMSHRTENTPLPSWKNNLGLTLIAIPIALFAVSLLERWGVLIGAYTIS